MKIFKIFSLPLFAAIVGFAGLHFLSCQHEAEAEQLTVKPLSDTPVTERACASGYCEYLILSDVSNTVELCGDLAVFTGTCTACDTYSNDKSIWMTVPTSAPATVCVLIGGSLCIRNPSTATQTMNITVTAGTGGSQNATIVPGQTACFHSNANCDATELGCQ
ncbi:MAG: hypothetical protein KIS77_01980 [Saprospiraceae bacterium]|nr:hypothetical protein [Saprospiraceae bacterium]